jgi:hypothetical protein
MAISGKYLEQNIPLLEIELVLFLKFKENCPGTTACKLLAVSPDQRKVIGKITNGVH